ncbi:hypothetical protein PZB75_07390 [Streptomyces sp. AM 4-1-1]|uniref:hypothetical protein n=1 Tax=Streptomyces sp. AM 4-1-1 TaxID=3028710 RepID=UPI0023B8DE3B|nr:hypothetical protein [Streptomyces sp. AM 4-1-1]WEH33218.1 hypothetical protein PZB75_07390 [Streptomyces sp. AM 4-1-1]
MNEGNSNVRLSWRTSVVAVCTALTLATAGAATARTGPADHDGAPHRTDRAAPPGGRTFVARTATAATETTLRLTLDATGPGGGTQKLSTADLERISALLGVPVGKPGRSSDAAAPTAAPATAAAAARQPAAKKGPATLRCDKNPSWSDARGTLSARFNCHHSTINWGYRISAKLRAVITGKVTEQGVSWWSNGRRKPRNAGHVVGKSYHFHGTLKPVRHGDHVQFQDHMTFRVNIGGRTGTGSLAWAADVRAKK